ncbi:DUF2264 domain-containing protein [Roseateles sp. DC23W]|uniref:DUF2264 domain-containing protein n=1 Tax=Pelomonas dachongensis TaxID=3299029 RepID=A0ABW7ETR7_9BURK
MERRHFMRAAAAGSALLAASQTPRAAPAAASGHDRAYLLKLMQQMAEPVLEPMSQGQLKQKFVLELSPTWDGRDRSVAYLEAFGRLMSGIAPWLALPADDTAEGQLRRRLQQQALQSYAHSVDPKSPDCLTWKGQGQALVDSAYFTNALMRAPKTLWEPLDATTKARIVTEIKGLRGIEVPNINWLLFAAMNEAWLLSIGEAHDPMRMNAAIRKINEWYIGDGWIKDGADFHFDYYGSYVMHPMLIEVLEVLVARKAPFWGAKPAELLAQATKRAQRFCEHLERFIGPEGTYPPIGRSLTYRTAVFQPLALLALRKQLPASLPEGQVRAALHAAHVAIWDGPSNFNAAGYLNIGFRGPQPELGDWYSNNGSMYIAAAGLLALGLPASDSYWTAPAEDWTQKKAFSSARFPKDYPVAY